MANYIYNPEERRGGELPKSPEVSDPYEHQNYVKKVLAATCNIFADTGISDGIGGYIVYRDPVDRNTYWLNPMGLDLSMVTPDTLIRVNWDGKVIEGEYPASLPAWASFTVIAEMRPNINAAVHFHTKYGSTWSSFGLPIDYITEDSAAFYNDIAVHDYFEGALVSREEGRKMYNSMGTKNSAILRNHGIYTVGETLDEAAWRFLALEKACECQIMLETLKGSGLHPKEMSKSALEKTAWMMGRPYACWLQFQPILKKKLGDGEYKQL